MNGELEFVIIRHGVTPGNELKRYVGVLDQPLSDAGRAQARARAPYIASVLPGVSRVYVSVLQRTHETAAILFPDAEQIVVEGIQEMNFGVFAGRSADEMADDERYLSWVDSYCEDRCPGGEARAQFTERVCEGVERLLRGACERGERRVVLVAHGGTMMATLSHFVIDGGRSYYEWLTGNCEGYRMDVAVSPDGLLISNVEPL